MFRHLFIPLNVCSNRIPPASPTTSVPFTLLALLLDSWQQLAQAPAADGVRQRYSDNKKRWL
jgi:hypothetical protein